MPLSTEVADLRAAYMRELARLNLRAWQGGPNVLALGGSIIALWPDGSTHEVTLDAVRELRERRVVEAS